MRPETDGSISAAAPSDRITLGLAMSC